MKRIRLRSRVLLLTAAFSATLFAITIGLSWRAEVAEARWSRLVGVETQAIAALDEIIRAQNAFRTVTATSASYRVVLQLLDRNALRTIDTSELRRHMERFASLSADPSASPDETDAESRRVVTEARFACAPNQGRRCGGECAPRRAPRRDCGQQAICH